MEDATYIHLFLTPREGGGRCFSCKKYPDRNPYKEAIYKQVMRGWGANVKVSFWEVYCVRAHTIYLAFAHNIPRTRTQYTLLKHTIYLIEGRYFSPEFSSIFLPLTFMKTRRGVELLSALHSLIFSIFGTQNP